MDTIIQEAIEDNDLQRIIDRLKFDPKLIDQVDDDLVHPSFIAAALGLHDIVLYLMSYTRVSQNIFDVKHNSILHYCAKSNHSDLFRYLVERINMDPLEVNLHMETPLDIAIQWGSDEIIAYYNDVLKIQQEALYKNPVLKGAYPDPSIVRVDEDYYIVNSSFIYFPCIPIHHSKDLIHWECIGHAIADERFIDMTQLSGGRGFWAPDISYYNNKFYITATFRLNDDNDILRKQMVVYSDKAEGPYSQPTFINEDGIDPSIFQDDDGKMYMLLNRGARILEISQDGSKQLSEAKMLWYGANKRAPEAPHILKKDGFYYCFVSEGGTGRNHQISVARSKTLMGHYEACPYNPILMQRDQNHPIQRSGHGKLVKTKEDEWYIVYLCSRMVEQKFSILGRESALDKVTWSSDGWPMINQNKGPAGVQRKPMISGDFEVTSKPDKNNSFKSLDWHFPRTCSSEFIERSDEQLLMVPGKYDLCDYQARNIMLKRQTDMRCLTSVDLHLEGLTDQDEIGMTVYYDENSYIKYYVTSHDENYFLFIEEKIGLNKKVSYNQDLNLSSQEIVKITLRCYSDGLNRRFSFLINDQERLFAKIERVEYLSDEGLVMGKRFTGTMIGLYAIDYEGTDSKRAIFSNFQMTTQDYEEKYLYSR